MIDKIVNLSWKIFPKFMILITYLIFIKLMFYISYYTHPFEFIFAGILVIVIVPIICIFNIIDDQ